MSLLRIVNDPRPGNQTAPDGTPIKNTELIDKLIALQGLPTSFYLRPNSQWTVLRHGLEPDVLENIPAAIYEKYAEPFEVDVVFPALEKGEKPWSEKKTVHALRLDTQTNDGAQALVDFERLVAAATPATQRPVKAEVVGDRMNWTMPVQDVPFVDLSLLQNTVPSPKPLSSLRHKKEIEVPKAEPPMKEGYCEACNKTFMNKRALLMHQRRSHKEASASREKVGI